MTTRTKLNLSSCTASAMMILVVFSKPLHIPDAMQWVLLLGVFIPLGLTFHFIKKQKQERLASAGTTDVTSPAAADSVKKARKRLILIMCLGVAVGLCSPLWMPLTGTTSGPVVDLICGLITAVIVCIIFGLRLRKLR